MVFGVLIGLEWLFPCRAIWTIGQRDDGLLLLYVAYITTWSTC